MAKKITGWKTKGMNRDLSVSAFNPEFSFENMNLRLSTNEGNTLLSWVNERGTTTLLSLQDEYKNPVENVFTGFKVLNPPQTNVAGKFFVNIYGSPVGTAVLNHKLVLFTHRVNNGGNEDRIYVCWYSDEDKKKLDVFLYFSGNLGLSYDHPLETLVSYEAEHIQKVYWTDGINQPRVANIYVENPESHVPFSSSTMFDFVPTLLLNETVKVKKVFGANGMFPPGVIQYALTYYNKYGQESNIFYTTHLCYISHLDRGASPDDTRVDNAFEITVTNIDTNFDYLRIYSIQRTSINGTPICKKVHDISLKDLGGTTAVYLDTGYEGETIDPTELLYKGGEAITAKTMENKDDTLFFGNVTMLRQPIDGTLRNSIKNCAPLGIDIFRRTIAPMQFTSSPYIYGNQLSTLNGGESQPCAGFNTMQQYMLGVQFQHKTGKWSDPVFLRNSYSQQPEPLFPKKEDNTLNLQVPCFKLTVNFSSVQADLNRLGYIKVRPVYVYPEQKDRNIVCEGVLNPTVYVQNKRGHDELYGQSSWFFRPNSKHTDNNIEYNCYVAANGMVAPVSRGNLIYTYSPGRSGGYNPDGPTTKLRAAEIQGCYALGDNFTVDSNLTTFHSPEIEFDTEYSVMDYSNLKTTSVGRAQIAATMSDINIQTETPPISGDANGFEHKSFSATNSTASFGIVAGLFYDDYIVDDSDDNTESNKLLGWDRQLASAKWMVYPWQKDGSLNNDINRPANKGIASAILKKKVISNLRYTNTVYYTDRQNIADCTPSIIKLFDSDDNTYLKLSNGLYQGNVDILLTPNISDGLYFAWDGETGDYYEGLQYYKFKPTTAYTPFAPSAPNPTKWWRTSILYSNNNEELWYGLQKYGSGGVWWKTVLDGTSLSEQHIGDGYRDLLTKKGSVRMKYKSTKHLVVGFSDNNKPKELNDSSDASIVTQGALQIVQLRRTDSTPYSDVDSSTVKNYTWIPCGKKVNISSNTVLDYIWGDTYYQRYDCLKTYPFTNEDPNQIVEVGSFMLETRVNIDGRYDRNRGQLNNGTISPRNFNLINPVYSQVDNFFNYKIQDTDKNETHTYPNYVYYSQSKTAGSDVDMWTHVTLASVLEMDGDKGQVNSLQRFNNQLIAFQDTGISQILYNENTQITTTDGVPIEIANSGKVQGKRYLSNTIGCSNKWSIVQTPSGIYFIDSHDKSIYFFNGQLQNLSTAQGFNTWAKKNIKLPLANSNADTPTWTPNVFGDFVSYYDKQNQDVLFINANTALAYSEKVGAFTSFYDYGHTPYFCNLDGKGIWFNGSYVDGSNNISTIYHHNTGNYCEFFGVKKPYWMTLVGNPEPQMDKIFTNLEFRACVDTDGTLANDKFTPLLPFDYLETWNEHQHGKATLQNKNGHGAQQHHLRDTNLTAALKRKFRIWRCDIPRDNYPIPEIPSEGTQEEIAAATTAQQTFFNEEADKGIYRKEAHPIDRMRNPWLYLKLMKNAAGNNQHLQRTEIHDILMSYFS